MPTIDHPDIKFNEIGFIKFGNSKLEQNFCDAATFQYDGTKAASDDHAVTYNLVSRGGDQMEPLVAVFTQMDDQGTINVEITTKKDSDSGNKILYRPPKEAVFNP